MIREMSSLLPVDASIGAIVDGKFSSSSIASSPPNKMDLFGKSPLVLSSSILAAIVLPQRRLGRSIQSDGCQGPLCSLQSYLTLVMSAHAVRSLLTSFFGGRNLFSDADGLRSTRRSLHSFLLLSYLRRICLPHSHWIALHLIHWSPCWRPFFFFR